MKRQVSFIVLLLFLILPLSVRAEKNIVLAPDARTSTSKLLPDDIEPPIAPPVSLVERVQQEPTWLLACLAVLLLALILLLIYLARKKKPQPEARLSPKEKALRALSRLEELLATEDWAAFSSLFDQTLRTYLESRFSIPALQLTASELVQRVAGEDSTIPEILADYRADLASWPLLCESGKFAASSLGPEEMTTMTTQLRAFLDAAITSKEDE